MDINFPEQEKKILKFWKKSQVFEKSISQRRAAKDFVFYEGPPTANGKPGIHHVLSRVFKDVICRYKTMRGFRVERKAGWDTHGLPVELEIEKKLGLKNKKDIDNYGIGRFNKKCRESVWRYKREWEKLTERIGFWLDLKNPYITYEPEYIETLWSILKEIFKKGLLFQDYKVIPYCPRCGTGLSSHEVAQGYEKIKEPAVYIKFRIKNPEFENTSLLVWTTTPWTLPGNVAVAVNPDSVYAKVKSGGENIILAKDRMEPCGLKDAEILQEFKGKELLDISYEAPYPIDSQEGVTIYRVISADFVSSKDGTGLVHIAPAFGADDMRAIKERGLELRKSDSPEFPILLPVNEEGKFKLEAKKWAGLFVKEADPLIIDDLKKRNLLFKEEQYEHDYPFCWRCRSPLLYYAKQSWFINMQEVKDDLIKNNQKINWIPSHLKDGRFGEWLKEVKDWAISRERYWGTPLPIWKCKTCGTLDIIGSRRDILSKRFSRNNYFVLRHGESLKNKKNINVCWPEKIHCPLTKKGKEQARAAARKLKNRKINFIFSSDLLRTKQTAEIVGEELDLPVKLDKRLREVGIGVLNGKPLKEAFNFWQEQEKLSPLEYTEKRFKMAAPGGENYFKVEKRLYDFMKEMEKRHEGKNILMVSHQRPITLLEKLMNGCTLKEFADIADTKKEIGMGEIKEIEFNNFPYNEKLELDFHRPYIDGVKFYCAKCGGIMERVQEVIDCWFDSGSMPFAQNHWLFERKYGAKNKAQKLSPPKLFPADYISEAIDQTRGWFYTLLSVSTLLGFESPYKNVISLGHILDEKGEKMSKSRGNVVDPWHIIDKYGVDAARWYFYTINQPGDEKLFSEKDVDGVLKKFILTFWNCYLFLETHGAKIKISKPEISKPESLLDRWIISKLSRLNQNVTALLDGYDVTGAARAIEKFTTEDLSLWYVRRSRRRFRILTGQNSEEDKKKKKDFEAASRTLGYVLLALSRLAAPFMPFLSEEIYGKITGAGQKKINSVHLESWPRLEKKLIDKKLVKAMAEARDIVGLVLAERAKAKIKVRQPLSLLKLNDRRLVSDKGLVNLIKEEVNVKAVAFDGKMKNKVELDVKITPELREEGTVREIIRNIQEMRKRANLKPKDRISVQGFGSRGMNKILEKNKQFILREGNVKDLMLAGRQKEIFAGEMELTVDRQKLWLAIKKI